MTACRRRVVVLMTPFPPFGSGEAATRGGVLAKLQTHWAKMPKIGHFEAMGLHFGGFGVNRGVLLTCEPLKMRINPLMRT